ncbi:MAG: hypothetical protein ACRDZW_11290, partial [Acidimicrobiales bacterium]
MPKIFRLVCAGLALLLSVLVAEPATAKESLSSTRDKREAVRQKRAKLASQINHLRATDAQLTAAVNVLDRQVATELARSGDARQSM